MPKSVEMDIVKLLEGKSLIYQRTGSESENASHIVGNTLKSYV